MQKQSLNTPITSDSDSDEWCSSSDSEIRFEGVGSVSGSELERERESEKIEARKDVSSNCPASQPDTVYYEKDLTKADLKNNPLANILEKDDRWALVRLEADQSRENLILESELESEVSEFLRSPPNVKQLCLLERKGVMTRVIVDSVRESGPVKCHGVDDGSRETGDWRDLRYLPSSLLQVPAQCIAVRLSGVPPPGTEAVQIIYLADKRGYPLVELIGLSSNVMSDSQDKTGGYLCEENNNQKETNDYQGVSAAGEEKIKKLEIEIEEMNCKMKNWALAYQNISKHYLGVFGRLMKMNQEKRNLDLKLKENKKELQMKAKEFSKQKRIEEEMRTQIETKERELGQKNEEIKYLKDLSWVEDPRDSRAILREKESQDVIRQNERLKTEKLELIEQCSALKSATN